MDNDPCELMGNRSLSAHMVIKKSEEVDFPHWKKFDGKIPESVKPMTFNRYQRFMSFSSRHELIYWPTHT